MKKDYEILEHTADLRIRIFGTTKQQLFLNALKAMTFIQNPDLSEESVVRKVKIKSSDVSFLLVDFLSEVLYLTQTKKEAYLGVR